MDWVSRHAVDLLLAAILLGSVVLGLLRGLVFEVLSLLGWVVAYGVSVAFAPRLAPWIPVGVSGSAPNHSAALILGFILALLGWTLASRIVRWVIAASPLSLLDRLLGALFGLLRGAVLLLAITTAVLLTPAAQSPAWTSAWAQPWMMAAVGQLRPLMPADLARWLPA
jgi:membrane protein required for colicin V production